MGAYARVVFVALRAFGAFGAFGALRALVALGAFVRGSVAPEGGGAAQSEPALPPLLPHPSLAGRLFSRKKIKI